MISGIVSLPAARPVVGSGAHVPVGGLVGPVLHVTVPFTS